jgi:hypothetical protein
MARAAKAHSLNDHNLFRDRAERDREEGQLSNNILDPTSSKVTL